MARNHDPRCRPPREHSGRNTYADRVLDVVERIPYGRVLAYGDVAEILGEGGPRQVAAVMSRWGDAVAWHRVLRADGTCAAAVRARQLPLLIEEGVAMTGGPDALRIDMSRSRWDGPFA